MECFDQFIMNNWTKKPSKVNVDVKTAVDIQMSEYLQKDEKQQCITTACYLKEVGNICSTTVPRDDAGN